MGNDSFLLHQKGGSAIQWIDWFIHFFDLYAILGVHIT